MRKQSYTRIDKEHIVEIRTLSPDEKTRGELDQLIRCSNLHGIFVESEHPFPAGAMVEVDLRVPGREGLYRMLGGVDFSSANPSDRCPAGMGIRLGRIVAAKTEAAGVSAENKPVESGASSGQVNEDKVGVPESPEQKQPETAVPAPTPPQIVEIFKGLLNTDMKVKSGKPMELEQEKLLVYGVYNCADDTVAAVVVADQAAVARIGSALSMIPAEEANNAAVAEQIPQEISENYKEVLNVSSEFFKGGPSQITLSDMYFDPAGLPADAAALLKGGAQRQDYTLEIEKYGSGRIVVFTRK